MQVTWDNLAKVQLQTFLSLPTHSFCNSIFSDPDISYARHIKLMSRHKSMSVDTWPLFPCLHLEISSVLLLSRDLNEEM